MRSHISRTAAVRAAAYLVTAAMALAACKDDPTRPVTYHLEMVSGSGQTDSAGALLPQPLVVRVRTSANRPAAGQMVTMVPATGSGSVSAASVVTDANGLAQVSWTLGASEGTASVRATLNASATGSATFFATVTAPTLRALVLSAGYEHNCAITASHQLFCWGINSEGQLGDGTTVRRNTAGAVPGALLFDRVATGMGHTCAVTTGGDMYCWGRNPWGQIGDGSTETRRTPVHVAPSVDFADVVAGAENTCGLSVTGSVYCWGAMVGSQSGAEAARLPADVSGGTRFRSLVSSDFHVCGMSIDGAPYCLEPTFVSNPPPGGGGGYLWRPQPAPSPTLTTFAGGLEFMCGLDAGGAASCWGSNDFGQLGTGTTQPAAGVVQVTGGLTLRGVYAGYDWSCGVTTTGPAYCWGHNSWGVQGPVVGQRFVEPSPHLLAVPSGLTFTAMDGGFYHMCGIAADTRVYCWGGGFNGQLGDGVALVEFYNRAMPAPVIRR